MAGNEIEDKRIEQIYKNLEYVSHAYFQAEGVFPFWEAAFALIVGQLFLAYFDPNASNSQQRWLEAVIGCIITYIWFILVSLNLQYSVVYVYN
jgi:hypothetical protein